MSKVKKKTGKSCKFSVTLEDIHRYLPITKWLPSYGLRKLQGDVIAGLTVGVMLVPHSLAQGTFAGLPPIYGLYTAFPGLFIYCLLGTCKDMNIGPTLVTALLANQYSLVDKKRPEIPAMLTFFSGLILLAIGLFKLGFVVRFISTPVISGFVSSAAIIIVVNQLHDLFGLRKHAKTFIGKLTDFFENIVRTKPGDAALGLTCLVLLITLGFVSKRKQNTKKSSTPSTCRTIGRSALFYAAIGKSPLIALLSTVVSYIFFITGYRNVFTLAGDMPSGLPSFQSPLRPVVLQDHSGNTTYEVVDVLQGFGAGLGVVSLIMFIQIIAVAKAFARRNKYKIDPSQELIALGSASMFASFFSAFPITGSISRTAVNSMSGAATTFSGVVTSIVVILALEFLTPVFRFIPKAGLAAMIIAAVLTMIEVRIIKKMWIANKIDLIPWAVSFFGCFHKFETGIIGGTIASIVIILYRDLRPRIQINEIIDKREITFKLNGGLWYTGIEAFSEKVTQTLNASSLTPPFTVFIDCQNMFEIDYTVAQGLHQLIADLDANDISVEFINIESKHVMSVLEKTRVIDVACEVSGETVDSDVDICYETAV